MKPAVPGNTIVRRAAFHGRARAAKRMKKRRIETLTPFFVDLFRETAAKRDYFIDIVMKIVLILHNNGGIITCAKIDASDNTI